MPTKVAWNKGLTKETDARVARYALHAREAVQRQYKNGRVSWSKGLTKETDVRVANISRAEKGRVFSPETRMKMSLGQARRWKNPEQRVHLISKLVGNPKLSHNMAMRWKNENYRKAQIERLRRSSPLIAFARKPRSLLHKQHIGQAQKRVWSNPEYGKRMLMRLRERPTGLEKQFIYICERYNLPFKYVGNGSFWVEHKNPDFIHTQGKKVCVEVSNPFHKSLEYAKERQDFFAKHGWECLVFVAPKLDTTSILSEMKKRGVEVYG